MKNKIIAIVCLALAGLLCLGLASCKPKEEVYENWTVIASPTCTEVGVERGYCLNHNGEHSTDKVLPALGHDMSEWQVTKEATFDAAGEESRSCSRCTFTENRPIGQVEVKYTISVVENDKTTAIYRLAEDGKYELAQPSKVGYAFDGYFDKTTDAAFDLKGAVDANVTIYSKWTLLDTTTFEQLSQRALNGAREIRIACDIEITDTVYVTSNTTIFVNKDVTLKRANGFKDDMFVLGENDKGENVLLIEGQGATLTLKVEGDNARLTIDGNKSNVEARGSALLILNSSTLNVYDDIIITNCKKVENDKLLGGKYQISYPERIGGAGICVANGELNLHGGEITECEVNLDETVMDETEEALRASSCGGAIYNYGSINVYNCKLTYNKASRGGAIYNYRDIGIYAGEFTENQATVYGGAIYLSGSQYAKTVIGKESDDLAAVSVKFANNASTKSGGALFGQTFNSIYVLGETLFENNTSTENNGGAINTSGSLTVEYAEFKNNTAFSKGGAVYVYYSKSENTARMADIKNALFQGNSASKGGALAVSASSDEFKNGAICYVGEVNFVDNGVVATYAPDTEVPDDNDATNNEDATLPQTVDTEKSYNGNGGAIYLSRKSQLTLNGTTFSGNTAERRGGAVYATGSSKLFIEGDNPVTFNGNSSVRGGACFVYSDSQVVADKVVFCNNQSAERGGALYVSSSNVTILDMTADGNQISEKTLPKKSDASGNPTEDDDTTECSGGAVSVYSNSRVNIAKLTANNNVATGNGGVLYVSGSTVTLSNVTANENKTEKGDGGVFAVHSNGLLSIDGITASDNSAENGNGGALYVRTSRAVIGAENSDNENVFTANSAKGGGAIYTSASEANRNVINIRIYSVKLERNSASSNAGALYAHANSYLVADNIVALGNSAAGNAGAVYAYSNAKVEIASISLTDNKAATNAGALYVYGSQADIGTITVKSNTATTGYAGAICINNSSVVNIRDLTATENTAATNGGAMYIYTSSTVKITGLTATENSSAAYGGVIYISGKASLTIDEVTATSNTANQGGFMYITTTDTTATLLNGDVTGNTASGGGNAIWSNTNKTVINIKGGESQQYFKYGENGIAGKYIIIAVEEELA